jgi:hypothetical protein
MGTRCLAQPPGAGLDRGQVRRRSGHDGSTGIHHFEVVRLQVARIGANGGQQLT